MGEIYFQDTLFIHGLPHSGKTSLAEMTEIKGLIQPAKMFDDFSYIQEAIARTPYSVFYQLPDSKDPKQFKHFAGAIDPGFLESDAWTLVRHYLLNKGLADEFIPSLMDVIKQLNFTVRKQEVISEAYQQL